MENSIYLFRLLCSFLRPAEPPNQNYLTDFERQLTDLPTHCIGIMNAMSTLASTEKPTSKATFRFARTKEVLMGESGQSFTIHTEVVCARSAYIAAALKEPWSTKNQPLRLPDDEPEMFDKYLGWVYNAEAAEEADRDNPDLGPTIGVYVLADKLLDTTIANLIIDSMIDRSDRLNVLPPELWVTTVYNNSRDLHHFVDILLIHGYTTLVRGHSTLSPILFLALSFLRWQEPRVGNVGRIRNGASRQGRDITISRKPGLLMGGNERLKWSKGRRLAVNGGVCS